ncbi:MAG: GNAT family N-acetyltransferase [Phycisphaerales bacterium]|nr:GNAT family N-acetyltransferase [Phycisphaerales bacterium]
MSDPESAETKEEGGTEAVRSGLELVRLPAERPQLAVAFLHIRSRGVMDLIAHFWERLSQTPPLQRGDLHLVAAMRGEGVMNEPIHTPPSDCGRFCGAMLYVPKAHRADVLALDEATAQAFASYITHQGPKAIKPDIPPSLPLSPSPSSPVVFTLTDFSSGRTTISDVPMMQFQNATANGGSNGGTNGGEMKVPIDFLTGTAEGIAWMTPLLLAAVHRKASARQLVNVVMQLTAECQPDPNVRVAREADIPTLNRWRRLYKEERGILFDADLDAWVHTQRIFVYEQDKEGGGQVVAVAKFDLELPSLIEIGGVYTFPEFRKRGYGAKIVSDLACRIRSTGKIPTLQVDEQNGPALRLYENAGWKPMGKLARVWLTK